MSQPGASYDTFIIERDFAAPLARVFAAFADPRVKQRWFAEGQSHDVERFVMQFEVGGREQSSYRFRPGTRSRAYCLNPMANFSTSSRSSASCRRRP